MSYSEEWNYYVKEGYLVRVTSKVNGVAVSDEERRQDEERWLKRARKKKTDTHNFGRDNFFGFKFEPGNYFYAGRETVDGQELVVIEYFPTSFFSEDDDDHDPDEEELVRKMDKATKVVIHILPEEHQIVSMNMVVNDWTFLPGRWAARVTGIGMTMQMAKPLGSVWMPEKISGFGEVTTARGTMVFKAKVEFIDYARTQTRVKFRFAPQAK
jgi:hypothetical protein